MSRCWLLGFIMLSGCVSSKVALDSKFDPKAKPSYEDYFDGYLFGWLGSDDKVDLARVCMDQKPMGFEHVHTGEDGFFTFLTLGIYVPSTVRVWCE